MSIGDLYPCATKGCAGGVTILGDTCADHDGICAFPVDEKLKPQSFPPPPPPMSRCVNHEAYGCENYLPGSERRVCSECIRLGALGKMDVDTLKSSKETVIDPNSRYYDAGGIETIDVIKAKLTSEQLKGYLLGNVIKYSCRLNYKGSAKRDAEKLKFYSQWLSELKGDEQ